MTAPICSIHSAPMRAGNKGGWYCTKKMPDGSFCTQRAKDAPQASPDAPVAPGASPATATATRAGASPKLMLLLGCLDFASRVHQGSCQGADAEELALSMFTNCLERAK